ncbi:hypothetical protein V6N13_104931 [Hibiscus sabdariffa]|uniref:Ribosomal protein S20 n=1 Tax=Hibiscus sabdariffa TaxID=183260 RepID=A0ABR2SJF4_9ROSI
MDPCLSKEAATAGNNPTPSFSHVFRRKRSRTMAYAAKKPTKPGLEEPQEQIHKIRITLSSKNVKNLEKVCADLVRDACNSTILFGPWPTFV